MFIINDQYLHRISDKIIAIDFIGLRCERLQQYLNHLSNTCANYAGRLGTKHGLTHGGFLAIFCKDYTTGETLQIGTIKVNGVKPKNGIPTPEPPEKAMDTTYSKGLYVELLGDTIKKGVRVDDKVIFASYENAGDPNSLVDIFLAEMNSYANELISSTLAA